MLFYSRKLSFYGSSHFQKGFLGQLGTVHLPAPFYEIMCLVYQEEVISAHLSLSEKAAQIGMRIKDVIVISDDHVGKKTHIQPHFKGTDLVPFRVFLYGRSVKIVSLSQQRIDCLIYPVKMASGPGAGPGIAIRLLQYTDLLSGCQGHGFAQQAALPHQPHRILRHRPGDGLGCEVKDLFRLALSHGLERREQGGDRLAGAGRRLQEKLPAMHNSAVAVRCQLLLPLPVGEGKAHASYGIRAQLSPLQCISRPFPVLSHEPVKPAADLLPGHALIEVPYLLGVQIAVGHPDLHGRQIIGLHIHIAIASGLCHMDRLRAAQAG